jgi:exopolysaccharide biosynthesis polyprenyl glycosylphosphotransferase
MKNNASLVYSAFLVVGDFAALITAFTIAYILRVTVSHTPISEHVEALAYISIVAALLPFFILIFALLGLYSSRTYDKRFNELGRLFAGCFLGTLGVISYAYFANVQIFPARLVVLYSLLLAFVFLVIFRNLVRLVRGQLFGYRLGLNNVLVVGNTDMSRHLVQSLINSRCSGYKVVAVVGGKRAVGQYTVPLYGHFSQFLKEHPNPNLHSIIHTELYADEPRNTEILTYAQEHHATYRFVPGNSELFVGNVTVELFQGSLPVITVNQTALLGWGRIAKRAFDLVVGTILLIIALPVMAFICFVMIVTDHGDPIFRQTRLGRYGEKIRIYKFRYQYHAYHRMTPEQGFTKMGRPELAKEYRANGDFLENDPRITPLGRFLRKTSLDELPQLLNVVKGEMSLVGPRPLEPFELDSYGKKNLILSVKTGLTGLAVVSGRRAIEFEDRRQLDLYYVQHWSFWLDLVILFKTVKAVLSREGSGV